MNIDNTTIWIIGGFVVIAIGLFLAKKLKVSFGGLILSFIKGTAKATNINEMSIKGSSNSVDQDVENKNKNNLKQNKLNLEGDSNKIGQDNDNK